ncbi:MAG: macrolide ABC transporter ATP-binding protein [Candidatus Buchananbacteria bacterium RBG_13_36_9]|uniref:Macrolide ABC transporter ATP-binding protein n=1 Tax=Candidatus Buchananbacteria bacterium RBG_13_36_9 TaxID=1797530 RepID=A0A1G1XNW0_9BACT|nr:MAG: macrolide ABC transporter ATP-binding protein [Candidatus Buchananbacteria bacterium RBG_13_36_9]
MAENILIKLEKLDKDYVNEEVVTHVLKEIDLEVRAGEFVAIMGPSGSGKSTLMHIMGFLDKPTSGKYYFKGKEVSNLTDDELAEIRNEEVGFIFQAFNLLQRTSVYDNVRLPLIYSQKKISREDVIDAVKSVGLYHRLNNLSNQLSGGEKQRVAIARALVNKPSIIFADEPTGNLDSKTGKQIMEILQDLNDVGKTIILVTHEKYTAEHARRIINLIDGKIVNDYQVKERLIAKLEKDLTK